MIKVSIGQKVYRYFNVSDALKVPMELIVTDVSPSVITCGAWDFNPENGAEIDEDLGWDGVSKTGSFIYTEPQE